MEEALNQKLARLEQYDKLFSDKALKIVEGDISDGYHTFGELYEHRCLLFINLCLAYPQWSWWRPHYVGWPLVGLLLPQGQISYHVPDKMVPLFKDKIRQGGPEWDGHTPEQVLERLRSFIEAKAARPQ